MIKIKEKKQETCDDACAVRSTDDDALGAGPLHVVDDGGRHTGERTHAWYYPVPLQHSVSKYK